MNHLLSAVLLAACSNIDNLGVGVAYGIIPRRIYLPHNLLIALVSGSGTYLSMTAGEWVNNYMSESFANAFGATIMLGIGLVNIIQTIRAQKNNLTEEALQPGDLREGTHGREALALAMSLTFNNLAGGLGAGISHINIPFTTLLTMVLSLSAIVAGFQLGKRASVAISKFWLGVASGSLIMLVGIYELFV